jgi:hypothetical protein
VDKLWAAGLYCQAFLAKKPTFFAALSTSLNRRRSVVEKGRITKKATSETKVAFLFYENVNRSWVYL